MVCIALAHGHGKTAADHIPQDIVEYHIRFPCFKEPKIFQKLEGGDDPSAGAAKSWCGAACLNAEDPAESDAGDVLKSLRIFVLFPKIIHDRAQWLSAQEVDRGIRLGIAADLDHLFSKGCKGCSQMAGNCGFSDSAFSVNSYFYHKKDSFMRTGRKRSLLVKVFLTAWTAEIILIRYPYDSIIIRVK